MAPHYHHLGHLLVEHRSRPLPEHDGVRVVHGDGAIFARMAHDEEASARRSSLPLLQVHVELFGVCPT